jgi:hypothetical protein
MDDKGTGNQKPSAAIVLSSAAKNSAFFFAEIKARFTEWLAQPTELRRPATQRGFAKLHGIHESTLSAWRPSLKNQVADRVRELAVCDLPDIIAALKREAYQGNIPAITFWMRYVLDWDPKAREASQPVPTEFKIRFGDEEAEPFFMKNRKTAVDTSPEG